MTRKKLENIINKLKDGLISIYLYHNYNKKIPVFVVKEVDFVLLDSMRSFFVREYFIILTEDDINEGKDVFCLKFLHIKNHSELFYGKHILSQISINPSDLRSSLELEIRNKLIQLREGYLSKDKGRYFMNELLAGMQYVWEGCLLLKYPHLLFPIDIQEMISTFDVAWSCNSQKFYYLIYDQLEESQIPSFIQWVHSYLVDLNVKVNSYK